MPSAWTAWLVMPACMWRTAPWTASPALSPAALQRCLARCSPVADCRGRCNVISACKRWTIVSFAYLELACATGTKT